MAKTYTLGKDQRLKSRKLIERIFREGKSFSQYPFRVTYILSERAHGDAGVAPEAGKAGGNAVVAENLQAGFGASSRNFKKAVDRNRIKRLTREAYRLQRQALNDRLAEKGKTLMVFFIYTGKELPVYALVTEKIAVILQKLNKELGV